MHIMSTKSSIVGNIFGCNYKLEISRKLHDHSGVPYAILTSDSQRLFQVMCRFFYTCSIFSESYMSAF